MAKQAQAGGSRLAVVLITSPFELNRTPSSPFTLFREALEHRGTDICLIDPYQELSDHALRRKDEPLQAPEGHFTAAGNRILAKVIAARLPTCGIQLEGRTK